MSLTTFSSFFYGLDVVGGSSPNQYIDFIEGSSEYSAVLTPGSYTPEEFADEVAFRMNAAGSYNYTAQFNRSTRKITIAADQVFDLPFATGTHTATSAAALLGFDLVDLTGLDTYESDGICGQEYSPQFILQDYVDSDSFRKAIDPVVNLSANGLVEVVKYGTYKFVELNIKYATDRAVDGLLIKNNATGKASLIAFMQYLVEKKTIEFMPDGSSPSTYQKLLLDKTPEDDKGLGYKLKELYDKGLPGFYETGVLRFRVID